MGDQVESIAFGGKGIVRSFGKVTFVPFTAPGDEILFSLTKQKPTYNEGELLKILTPSPMRTEPLCPYFGTCGGCQLQHIRYEEELQVKRSFVQDALQRIAKCHVDLPLVHPSPREWGYREHITLHIEEGRVGYIAVDNKTVVPISYCPLFEPEQKTLIAQITALNIAQKATVRLLKSENRYIAIFSAPLSASALLKKLPSCKGVATPKEEAGDLTLETTLDNLKLRFSPYGFLQNNRLQSINLLRALLAMKSGNTLLDLYCGMGISSLFLASAFHSVVGVEINESLVDTARHNAAANNIHNVHFHATSAEKAILPLLEKHTPDAVLLNPPREGAAKSVIEALLSMRPKAILYISCMPPTFARDLSHLQTGGYKLQEIQLFDMFPKTTHVEIVAKLIRHA